MLEAIYMFKIKHLSTSLLCMCSYSAAAQTLKIEEAVAFWKLDGAKFDNIKRCAASFSQEGDHEIVYFSPRDCIVSELATHTLIKECSSGNKKNIVMLDTTNKKLAMSFEINDSNCALVMGKQPRMKPSEASATQNTDKKKTYVIQFYSGENQPQKDIGRCVQIPLKEHYLNNSYYVFSESNESYRSIKTLLNKIKSKCPETEMWIRPVLKP